MRRRHATVGGGTVTAVYDDRWVPLLSALGSLSVARATRVEWDAGAQEWVATLIEDGREIARGTNRAEVIAAEIALLDGRLAR